VSGVDSVIGTRRSLKGWLEQLAGIKLTQKVAQQLVERGIVQPTRTNV
jgi:hypothetical protein